jgi:azurin
MTLQIPGRVYAEFSTVMGFPGTLGLTGIQEEVNPTQDLTRILQNAQAKRVEYHFSNTPAGNLGVTIQWTDASDFASVIVNGITTTDDADLPQPSDFRMITGVYLQIEGTQADYTSFEFSRINSTGAIVMPLVSFGAIVAGHSGPTRDAPNIFPQVLSQGGREASATMILRVSGAAAVFQVMITMIAGPPGLFSTYPGV